MKLLAANASHLNTSVHICQNELCSLKSHTKEAKTKLLIYGSFSFFN